MFNLCLFTEFLYCLYILEAPYGKIILAEEEPKICLKINLIK